MKRLSPAQRDRANQRYSEDYLELVAQFQMEGMSQDDAEIAAACKLEEIAEMNLFDRGEDAFEALQDRDY